MIDSMKIIKLIVKCKRHKYRNGIILVIVLVIIYAVLNLGTSMLDPNAILGKGDTKTIEEIESELQQMVKDGMFRVKINQNPNMDVETGATNIIVQNSVENTFLKQVIYYDEQGEIVYETRILSPSDGELNAVFPGQWEIGVHNLTASVIAIDVEQDTEMIVTEMDIILTVK